MKGGTGADLHVQALSLGDGVISQLSRASAEFGQTSEDSAPSMRDVIGVKIVASLGYLRLHLALLLSFYPLSFLFPATYKSVLNR